MIPSKNPSRALFARNPDGEQRLMGAKRVCSTAFRKAKGYIDNVLRGSGSAPTKRAAKEQAAEAALNAVES